MKARLFHYRLSVAVLSAMVFLVQSTAISGGREYTTALPPVKPLTLLPNEKLITILGTNDIHGAVEHSFTSTREPVGGLAILGGIFAATKAGLQKQYGEDRAGTLVVDTGDQFQGSILSHLNEGELVFGSMNEMEYAAAVPGAHAYDFGPIGWQVDVDPLGRVDRRSLLNLISRSHFPLVSANTYYRNSFSDVVGVPIPAQKMEPVGCRASNGAVINWARAVRPEFLVPYVIKNVAGVRVALIGIDHVASAAEAVSGNVSDLCFRDEAQAYFEVRSSLQGQADIFVMLLHAGNTDQDFPVSEIAAKLLHAQTTAMPNVVDAIFAGNTHLINNHAVGNVPIVQSGIGARSYSRVDLIWDGVAKRVVSERTRARGGLPATFQTCPVGLPFCQAKGNGQILIENAPVVPYQLIATAIESEKKRILPIVSQSLTQTQVPIPGDWLVESPLTNLIADHLREASGAQVALFNATAIKTALPAGLINYGFLFQTLPSPGVALLLQPMEVSTLIAILRMAIRTCGEFDSLAQSGLRVEFERQCALGGLDPQAKLVSVQLAGSQELIYQKDALIGDPNRKVSVVINSVLSGLGSPYLPLQMQPVQKNLGNLRDLIAQIWHGKYARGIVGKVDGRWANLKR